MFLKTNPFYRMSRRRCHSESPSGNQTWQWRLLVKSSINGTCSIVILNKLESSSKHQNYVEKNIYIYMYTCTRCLYVIVTMRDSKKRLYHWGYPIYKWVTLQLHLLSNHPRVIKHDWLEIGPFRKGDFPR